MTHNHVIHHERPSQHIKATTTPWRNHLLHKSGRIEIMRSYAALIRAHLENKHNGSGRPSRVWGSLCCSLRAGWTLASRLVNLQMTWIRALEVWRHKEPCVCVCSVWSFRRACIPKTMLKMRGKSTRVNNWCVPRVEFMNDNGRSSFRIRNGKIWFSDDKLKILSFVTLSWVWVVARICFANSWYLSTYVQSNDTSGEICTCIWPFLRKT